jgi:hypothetical protein
MESKPAPACKLLELHILTGTRNGAPIALEVPQGRLAGTLGASRENVNRALGGFWTEAMCSDRAGTWSSAIRKS